MLTAMTYVELVTTNAGQEVSVFTCDQKLYRVKISFGQTLSVGKTFIRGLVECIG